tara:strand:- start:1406 stop:1798 length:393 start_codon:yes stop_codon:yes gene_type:complete
MIEQNLEKEFALNVLGEKLQLCSCTPKTGWFRDGYCHFDKQDGGNHTICCVMNTNFLNYSRSQGNDLITPMPEYSFEGLKPGDHWCVCLERWKQALQDGLAPYVVLESTNKVVLKSVSLEVLKKYQYIKK